MSGHTMGLSYNTPELKLELVGYEPSHFVLQALTSWSGYFCSFFIDAVFDPLDCFSYLSDKK